MTSCPHVDDPAARFTQFPLSYRARLVLQVVDIYEEATGRKITSRVVWRGHRDAFGDTRDRRTGYGGGDDNKSKTE
jgi:hypothetical protein